MGALKREVSSFNKYGLYLKGFDKMVLMGFLLGRRMSGVEEAWVGRIVVRHPICLL